jgi:hypothetical protein
VVERKQKPSSSTSTRTKQSQHKVAKGAKRTLSALAKNFDELFLQMQSSTSRKAAGSLLTASAKQLNQVARKRSKRRG